MKPQRWIAWLAALAMHAAVLSTSKLTQTASAAARKKEYVEVTLENTPAIPTRAEPISPTPPPPPKQQPARKAPQRNTTHAAPAPSAPVEAPAAEPDKALHELPVDNAVASPMQPSSDTSTASATSSPAPLSTPIPTPKRYVTVRQPSYARSVEPTYPLPARRQRQQGTVTLALFISELGSLDNVELRKSSGYPLLDEAALASIKQSRFHPAYQGSAPVPSRAEVSVTFRLQ